MMDRILIEKQCVYSTAGVYKNKMVRREGQVSVVMTGIELSGAAGIGETGDTS